jgi:hypothetical protein
MIDRDSYSAGGRGHDEFVADARALLELVRSYSALDVLLERPLAAQDVQLLVNAARRALAATAVDELGAMAELMADVAHELDAPIEEDLRAAKRLIEMTYAESSSAAPLPTTFRPVETLLFDPAEIPEFRSWRTDKFRQ